LLRDDSSGEREEFFSEKGECMSDVNSGAQSRLRESISALVDGEADELELRRVLASTDTQDLRETWRDYHLQRDMLTGANMQFAHIDISQRLQAALADEAMPMVVGSRWWRPLASVAVAASVATVVVMGARSFTNNGFINDSNSGAPLAQSQPMFNLRPGNVALSGYGSLSSANGLLPSNGGIQPVSVDPDQLAEQRLQQYLLQHTERASWNNGQGVINFAKVSQLNDVQ
jgi:sigma-E factor negative regulatory protein RseA